MARQQVLDRLRELGWDGPTSYTLPYLNELIGQLENGAGVEDLKASRKKTSSPEVKGRPREPRQRPEKGEWVACDNPIEGTVAGPEPQGELEHEGVRYRWNTVVEGADMNGDPTNAQTVVHWYRFTAPERAAKKPKVKLPSQEASFDPRTLLRVFENHDMRIRTGGRDWTMVDVDIIDALLDKARTSGATHVVVDVDGSAEQADVVWLDALRTVKRRLANREEEPDAPAAES